MPTPFYHIRIAEDLLTHPELAGEVRDILNAHACIFRFGHTAPDVQTISGQSREATHFFTLPIHSGELPPWQAILVAYPHLVDPRSLTQEQAVFLAGYLCHLQADWYWVREIFAPIFGPSANWGAFPERLYLHNVLRSYLDQQVYRTLPKDIGNCLESVSPAGWLPFVKDEDLSTWRHFLSTQLQPGSDIRTVEVFAERQGISPEEFYAILESQERMEQEIFNHISNSELDLFRQRLIAEHLQLVQSYLSSMIPAPTRAQVYLVKPNQNQLSSFPGERA